MKFDGAMGWLRGGVSLIWGTRFIVYTGGRRERGHSRTQLTLKLCLSENMAVGRIVYGVVRVIDIDLDVIFKPTHIYYN